jgi:hypothetical protein
MGMLAFAGDFYLSERSEGEVGFPRGEKVEKQKFGDLDQVDDKSLVGSYLKKLFLKSSSYLESLGNFFQLSNAQINACVSSIPRRFLSILVASSLSPSPSPNPRHLLPIPTKTSQPLSHLPKPSPTRVAIKKNLFDVLRLSGQFPNQSNFIDTSGSS